MLDLTGEAWWSSAWSGIKKAAVAITDSKVGVFIHNACALTWGAVATACSSVYAVAYAVQGRWGEAAGEVLSAVSGGAANKIVKFVGAVSRSPWISASRKVSNLTRKQVRAYDRTVIRGANTADVVFSAWILEAHNKMLRDR
jgi:hypothetical protein